MTTIGVLALQGDFAEHLETLRKVGVTTREVRLPRDVEGLDGLVIPGGESTTMARLMDVYQLREPLKEHIQKGMAVLGTCAGMILLARRLEEERPEPLGVMDIQVKRNAFGRQVDSFEADLAVPAIGPVPFHAVFIRAPVITRLGPQVQVLASLPGGQPVAARQGKLVGTAFHPELTPELRFHRYFLELACP